MVETTSVVADDRGFTTVVDKVISAEEFEKQKVDASQFTLDAKLKAGVPLTEVKVNLPGSDIEPGLINSSFAQSEKEEENEEIINE